jgi:hypothetical protein
VQKSLRFDQDGFADQLLKDVSVPSDIDKGIIEQSSLFAYYAQQAYLSAVKADKMKIQLEAKEALKDKEIRDAAIESGSKITEKAIEGEISRDPTIMRLKLTYSEAKANANMMRDMLEAFKQRASMLMQLGSARREEMKGQMRVMGERSDLKDRALNVISTKKAA